MCLRRDPDQRFLLPPRVEVPVERVVAEVGLAADEPAGERRPGIVEHLIERPVPVNELRLLGPEALPVLDRAPVEVPVGRHSYFLVFSSAAILSHGRSMLARLNAPCRNGSRRRRTSLEAPPRRSAFARSNTLSAVSMSPGRPAGLAGRTRISATPMERSPRAGLAGSAPTMRSPLLAPARCSRCRASFIRC